MSPNQYYEENFSGFDGGRASARQVERMGQNVEAAFDKLPEERTLKENRVNYAVATAISAQAFAVTLPHPITDYIDGMFIPVKMPRANAGPATIDVDGVGAKEIRDIQGNALLVDQWAANAIVGLRYTDEGTGRFILQGGGVRGEVGPQGPPDGTFSLNAANELLFTATGGAVTNLGPAAPLFRGGYSSTTAYAFLHIVRAAGALYLHVGRTTTTGTPVTDGAVWHRLAEDGADAALRFAFSVSTAMSNPANGDVRLNNAAPGGVTRIAVDDLDADGNDVSGYVATFDDLGAAGNRGTLFIRDRSNRALLVYRVTGLADNAGWTRLDVAHVSGASLPADDAELDVWFLPAGPAGADGQSAPTVPVANEAAYNGSAKTPNTIYYWTR